MSEKSERTAGEHPWQVSEWGSHPDDDNDDCWRGRGFDCEVDARRFFWQDAPIDTAYLELDGPTAHEVRRNPPYFTQTAVRRREAEARAEAASWRREQAIEAGQLGGVDAYNDVMGCSLDNPQVEW